MLQRLVVFADLQQQPGEAESSPTQTSLVSLQVWIIKAWIVAPLDSSPVIVLVWFQSFFWPLDSPGPTANTSRQRSEEQR